MRWRYGHTFRPYWSVCGDGHAFLLMVESSLEIVRPKDVHSNFSEVPWLICLYNHQRNVVSVAVDDPNIPPILWNLDTPDNICNYPSLSRSNIVRYAARSVFNNSLLHHRLTGSCQYLINLPNCWQFSREPLRATWLSEKLFLGLPYVFESNRICPMILLL
jgi:hypothetical protein